MANSNRGVAAFRARERNPNAMWVDRERQVYSADEADTMADEWRTGGTFARVTSARVRGTNVWVVRGFVRGGVA